MTHEVKDVVEILPDGKKKWLRSQALLNIGHDLQTQFQKVPTLFKRLYVLKQASYLVYTRS